MTRGSHGNPPQGDSSLPAHEVAGQWQMQEPVRCGREEPVQIELHLAPILGRLPQTSGSCAADAQIRTYIHRIAVTSSETLSSVHVTYIYSSWFDFACVAFAGAGVVTPVRGLVALLPPGGKLPAGVDLNEELRRSGHGLTEATAIEFEVPESQWPGSAYDALQQAVKMAFQEVRVGTYIHAYTTCIHTSHIDTCTHTYTWFVVLILSWPALTRPAFDASV